MLSRPVDTDATSPTFPPMEKGFYKWQVKNVEEYGSNKDLNIKGLTKEMSEGDKAQVNVLSLRWQLQCVGDPRYDGSAGGKAQTRFWFTTYWASDDKIEASYQNSKNKYIKENPTATEEDIDRYVRKWKPQTNLFEFLFACGLMEKVEDDTEHTVEFKPVGWELNDAGLEQAIPSALNCIVFGKIDSQTFGDRTFPDSLVGVYQVKEN